MALKIAGNDSFKVKNIADLQQLDTLPSSATVIVEHGGFAKRFDASKLEGKVRSVNGVEPDENGNVQIEVGASDVPEINFPVTSVNGMTGDVVIEIPESFSGSWNDLTDKPFGEVAGGNVIKWDGNTEGMTEVSFPVAEGMTYYKVSDLTPSAEEILEKNEVSLITRGNPQDIEVVDGGIISEGVIIVNDYNVFRYEETSFPANGLYFAILSESIGDSDAKTNSMHIGFEYDSNNFTWDGTILEESNKVVIDENSIYYKISDLVLTSEELAGSYLTISQTMINMAKYMSHISENWTYLTYAVVVYNTEVDMGEDTFTFPSTGIYLAKVSMEGTTGYATSFSWGDTSVKFLDDKYLSSNIARVSNVVTSVNGMSGDVIIEAGAGVTSWNDLTERPFSKEISYEELLPETTLNFSPVSGMGVVMGHTSLDHTKINEGQIYTVILDGVTYESEVFMFNAGAQQGIEAYVPYIGNPGLVAGMGYGEDNGLPFIAGNGYGTDGISDSFSIIMLGDASEQHTFGLSTQSVEIKQLDSIYLPDALQIGGEDTTTLIEWDGQVGDKDTFQHDWHMAKVSDLLPTKEDLIGGYYDNYGTQATITEDIFSESTGCVGVSGRFAVVTELEGQLGNYSYTAPSTGIYFAYSSSSGSVKCGYLKYGEDNITRFDEKFIPLSIARKGEISWNDLLDKPFGTETVEAESFSMQDMEFVGQSFEEGPTFYMYQLTDPFMTLHPDAEYLVNWGGVESTTLCQKLEPYTVLGNVGILADTLGGQVPEGLIATNEDYVIMKMEMGGQYYGTVFITTNSEQYVNITIQGPDHVDHKIDPKYLPTSVGSGLPEVSEEDEGKILQVVGGRWQLVTLVNTEEVEY